MDDNILGDPINNSDLSDQQNHQSLHLREKSDNARKALIQRLGFKNSINSKSFIEMRFYFYIKLRYSVLYK